MRTLLSATWLSAMQTVLTAALVAAPGLTAHWLDAHIPPESRSACIRWLLSTNLLALSLCLYLYRKTRLTPRFGLLWDRRLNAFCPRCRVLLANRMPRNLPDVPALRDTMVCFQCDRLLYPDLGDLPPGIVRDFTNARRIIRKQPPETSDERKAQREAAEHR